MGVLMHFILIAKMLMHCLKGTKNLEQHYENLLKYRVPVLIAINHFATDSKREVDALISWCRDKGYRVTFVDSFLEGSNGAIDFAQQVVEMLHENRADFKTAL